MTSHPRWAAWAAALRRTTPPPTWRFSLTGDRLQPFSGGWSGGQVSGPLAGTAYLTHIDRLPRSPQLPQPMRSPQPHAVVSAHEVAAAHVGGAAHEVAAAHARQSATNVAAAGSWRDGPGCRDPQHNQEGIWHRAWQACARDGSCGCASRSEQTSYCCARCRSFAGDDPPSPHGERSCRAAVSKTLPKACATRRRIHDLGVLPCVSPDAEPARAGVTTYATLWFAMRNASRRIHGPRVLPCVFGCGAGAGG